MRRSPPDTPTEGRAGLIEADERRRRALLEMDLGAVRELLDDELIYMHSNGVEDDKDSYVQRLDGEVRYREIEVGEPVVRAFQEVGIVSGNASVRAVSRGDEVEVRIAYTAVYARRPERWRMVHWHATQLPEQP